jgi:hypothetical protein
MRDVFFLCKFVNHFQTNSKYFIKYEIDPTRLWLLQLLKEINNTQKKITTNQYIKEHIDILFVYMDNPELYKGPII